MLRHCVFHYPEDFHEDPNFVMSITQSDKFIRFKAACEQAGAILISTMYVNSKSLLWFYCSRCGRPHYTTWNKFQQGKNKEFLCIFCTSGGFFDISSVKSLFAKHDAILIASDYRGVKQDLEFYCRCGRRHHIRLDAHLSGVNPHLLCPRCQAIFYRNPTNVDLLGRVSCLGGPYWYSLIRMFFNVKEGNFGTSSVGHESFAGHHIYNYAENPLLRSSFTNGYPILTEYHKDQQGELFKIIHSDKWYNPQSWNSDEFQNKFPQLYSKLKLPYHNYPGFCFYNPAKYLVTEIIIPSTDMEQIHQNEKYWRNRGIIYIPVSWETLAWKPTRDEFFSQIRDELRQFIPEIDQYTGVGFNFKEYLKTHSF